MRNAMAANTEKPDKFSSIIKLCFISPSQEEKLLHCPFDRESEFCDELPLFSSLEPTQLDPTQIFMLSLPETQRPAEEEDDAVFVTPPEQHLRSTSSGQNAAVDLKITARVRVSDEGLLAGERQLRKIRASQDEDTVPVCETEPIDGEIGGGKSEVVVLDSDSEEEMGVGVESGKGKGKVLGGNGSGGKCEARDVEMDKECRNGDGSGSSKVEGEIAKRKADVFHLCDAGNSKANRDSGVNRDTGNVRRRGGTSDNGFDEIDKFWYNGGGDAERRMKLSKGGVKRQLPVSIQGKKNDGVKKKHELDDVVKILEMFVADDEHGGGGSEDVDFLATAKKQGIVFPRPRWWPPEGGDG